MATTTISANGIDLSRVQLEQRGLLLSLLLLQEKTGETTTSPPAGDNSLETQVMWVILIFIGVLILALVAPQVLRAIRSALGKPTAGAQGKSWLDYGNFFVVITGIVTVLLAFLFALVFYGGLFRDPTQLLALLTALFGVIGTLVGTYFGVKAGSDAAQGAQNLAGGVITPTGPAIVAVDPQPSAGGVPRGNPVSATFSVDMNPATITNATFRLIDANTGAQVPGNPPTYDLPTKRAVFQPAANLVANTPHQATITTGVQDLRGNALPADFTWLFTTGP